MFHIKKYKNLKIKYKISLIILLLFIGLLSFVYLTFILLFRHIILKDSLDRAIQSTTICSSSLEETYKDHMLSFIRSVGTNEFKFILRSIKDESISISDINNSLQSTLTSLTATSSLVDSTFIRDINNNIYRCYGIYPENNSDYFFYDLNDIHGITVLSERQNPFVPGNQVIPIVIPLGIMQSYSQNYTVITEDPTKAVIFITLLIDSDSLNNSLNYWYNNSSANSLFLVNEEGNILNTSINQATLKNNQVLLDSIQVRQNSNILNVFKNEDYYAIISPKFSNGITLINVCPISSFMALYTVLRRYIIMILLAGLLLTSFVTILVSHFVTKPIVKLIKIVRSIQANTYTELIIPNTRDEIGHLHFAINNMYKKIQEQIEYIKIKEAEKYHAEITLLAEQINPHLLYNALEYINMEIYSEHNQSASSMVQALANYMRISLSYGSEKITIRKEIEQVQSYISIMNYRFHNIILLLTYIEPEIQDYNILKSILQPFVENSIKHGFSAEAAHQTLFNPTIEVHISHIKEHLILEINDNGIGFDVLKLETILYENGENQSRLHVGLRNVIKRLNACYTNVDIQLESIPFYKNTIKIILPFED